MKRKRLPRHMCCRVACPDCGLIVHDPNGQRYVEFNGKQFDVLFRKVKIDKHWRSNFSEGPFDCPRCKAHYVAADFWLEQQEKWSREIQPELESA